jgi:hypothetical protein
MVAVENISSAPRATGFLPNPKHWTEAESFHILARTIHQLLCFPLLYGMGHLA